MDTFMCQYNRNFLTPADVLLAIIKIRMVKKKPLCMNRIQKNNLICFDTTYNIPYNVIQAH